MSEEHACLVRARSDSESSAKLGFGTIHGTNYTDDRTNHSSEACGEPTAGGTMASPTDNNADGDAGELLDYNDAGVLEQFHEDALKQAGCGLSQVRVFVACALALCGAALELTAIPFILPSAEIELCILPHEKNWLVLISLVGSSLGSVGWGSLGGRLGRRRALLSCLAVNAVFATIAAFMPTYGTFMMARFCSAIGSGGIVPISYTYSVESSVSRWAGACVGGLVGAGAGGAVLAPALAVLVLPGTATDMISDNKEHFSAWHRYLLLCTLPILASLVSLIWTQESPRYLLDVGREVDAMMVYQTIHNSNQSSRCGTIRTEYRLGELSLPGKRRPPALHHVRHSVKQFWQAFYQLFSSPYRRPTLCMGGTLLCLVSIQFYLSSHIPAKVIKMDNDIFDASTQIINNVTYESEYYNTTKENMEYNDCTFRNCTFKDLLMTHVSFKNCTFINSAFSNIKTSRTWFLSVDFVNSTIIDTDMEIGRELDSECTFEGSIVRGVQAGCSKLADLTYRLGGLVTEQTYVSYAMFIATVFALTPRKFRRNVCVSFCVSCVLLSLLVYVADTQTAMYLVEAAFRLAFTVVFMMLTLQIVEEYPANLRCTAHGLIVSVTYACAAVVRGCGPEGAGAGAAGGGGGAGVGAGAGGAALLCTALAACALVCLTLDR